MSEDFNNLKIERSLSSGDVAHNFSVDWLYQAPTPFKNLQMARQILGGWNISGIWRARTGLPLGVTQTGGRPDLIDFQNAVNTECCSYGHLQYLNKDAFQLVTVPSSGRTIRRGNAGATALRGPGMWNLDLSFGKSFRVTEGTQFEFKTDMLNAFNHTQFSALDTAAQFGATGQQILGAAWRDELHQLATRSPISAKLVADLLETAGATRVVSMDMHAGQIQGFFNVPFDHLYAAPVLLEHMRKRFDGASQDVVIVSPDAGGVERARAYSKRLGSTLGIVDKRRTKPNVAEIMNVIGEVQGKVAVLLDDMIDTAGTLTQAANALMDKGATKVYAYATHPVLSGPAVDRIMKSSIEEVVVTDTIQLAPHAAACPKIRQLSVAGLLAEAMRRIHSADSLSSLFV